jgi:hypothetical protein
LPCIRTDNARRKDKAVKLKNNVLTLALVLATGAMIACFGLFSKKEPKPIQPTLEQSCEGLEGEAREECEARKSSAEP